MAGAAIQVQPVPGPLTPDVRAEVLALVDAATTADGIAPLSEQALLHLRAGEPADLHLLARAPDGTLTGYAHLDHEDPASASGELVVAPQHRRLGHGHALAEALVAEAGGRELGVWAHGDLPGARALARDHGFTGVRELWQLRRPLTDPLPEPQLPAGVQVRTFRPGADEAGWLALNAAAFAAHPEQGRWTADDLRLREQEPWFDPHGFFLAVRPHAGGEELLGFHWTKVHPADAGHRGGEAEPLGEVYVVGVHPHAQGSGLGRALTLIGLHHLRARGLGTVLLYVDADNAPAVAVYERLGFTRHRTDVMFTRARDRAAMPAAVTLAR